jgi:trehalose/maltose hydrolase-like predicted phosphorylase
MLDWTPPGTLSPVSLKFTTFAHRARPNLGVVRLDASNLPKDAEITVTDLLDVSRVFQSCFSVY